MFSEVKKCYFLQPRAKFQWFCPRKLFWITSSNGYRRAWAVKFIHKLLGHKASQVWQIQSSQIYDLLTGIANLADQLWAKFKTSMVSCSKFVMDHRLWSPPLLKKLSVIEFFWSAFFRIRTEYVQGVSFRIQAAYRRMQVRKTPNMDTFSAVPQEAIRHKIQFPNPLDF